MAWLSRFVGIWSFVNHCRWKKWKKKPYKVSLCSWSFQWHDIGFISKSFLPASHPLALKLKSTLCMVAFCFIIILELFPWFGVLGNHTRALEIKVIKNKPILFTWNSIHIKKWLFSYLLWKLLDMSHHFLKALSCDLMAVIKECVGTCVTWILRSYCIKNRWKLYLHGYQLYLYYVYDFMYLPVTSKI